MLDRLGKRSDRRRVAVLLKGYPRLSETFIAQELLSLERAGLDFEIFSLRLPTDKKTHPVHNAIQARVTYLPEYLHWQPLRVLKAWWRVRKFPGYREACALWRGDLERDRSRNRVRRFGQALVLADLIANKFDWIYVHFLHTPASVGRYGAHMAAMPWSCSSHAKDIYTLPDWEVAEKVADARWLVTCTRANVEHLRKVAPSHRAKISLLYHGLDFSRFPPFDRAYAKHDGSDPRNPVTILSVGRAVEKKGYDVLLAALAALERSLSWRFVHIGGGERLASLKRRAEALGIGERISWLGPRPQQEVLDWYRKADLFVLASLISPDGDRDGLPNVLMEAQSQRLACISTDISAIPELIEDGATGLLVTAGDSEGLTDALKRLITTPDLRQRFGDAGEKRVRSAFSHDASIAPLVERFELSAKVGAGE